MKHITDYEGIVEFHKFVCPICGRERLYPVSGTGIPITLVAGESCPHSGSTSPILSINNTEVRDSLDPFRKWAKEHE